jgi:hypothetical protein
MSDQSTNSEPVFLFFWLPAGKNAFGSEHWARQPLNIISDLKADMERPICAHFAEKVQEHHKKLEILDDASIQKSDEFATSKIEFRFRYCCSKPAFPAGVTTVPGVFRLFSNGLYLWQFDMPGSAFSDGGRADVVRFLKEDFMINYIEDLFHCAWGEEVEQSELGIEGGILTEIRENSISSYDPVP